MFRATLVATAALSALLVSACSKPAPATDATADATTPAASAAATPAATPAPMTAADFVTKVASSDMFEITEAKMAEQKATKPDIKAFASKMIKDHTANIADLKTAIAKSGQTLTLPAALPADLQAKVDDLAKTSGGDFDKTYVTQQVDAHTTALGVVQGYAMAGDVPALKDYAAATAKVVQDHLDMANKIQASMTK
jgi:putative membrane protein